MNNRLIVVHGVKTFGLPQLPMSWGSNVGAKAPLNSRIWTHDVQFDVGKEMKWQLFASESQKLLDIIRNYFSDELEVNLVLDEKRPNTGDGPNILTRLASKTTDDESASSATGLPEFSSRR